jgi:hypothetical protein
MKKIIPFLFCFALTGCTWHVGVKDNTHTWDTSSPDLISTVPYWIHFNF